MEKKIIADGAEAIERCGTTGAEARALRSYLIAMHGDQVDMSLLLMHPQVRLSTDCGESRYFWVPR